MPAPRKGEEYPSKSGILITPKRTAAGSRSWRVEIAARITGGLREQRQFPSKADAEEYAEKRWAEIQSVGFQAFSLTAAQRTDAARAFALLAGSDLSLSNAVELALKHTTKPSDRLTVAQLRSRFLAEPGRRRNRLVQRRSRSLGDLAVRTAVFAKCYGELRADAVTAATVKEWLAGMASLSAQSRNNYRRAVHAMFAFAVREGHCGANPVSTVPAFAVSVSTPAILTVAQAQRLVEAAARTNSELGLLPFVTLGLFAGLRRAELERLTWDAVKADRSMVTVGPDVAKTGSIRNVRLTPNAMAWLSLQPFQAGPVAPRGLNKRFKKLRLAAGLSNWEGNELRHSYASYLFDQTQDAGQTSAALGHSSGSQLLFRHYRSLVPLGEGERYFGIRPDVAGCSAGQVTA